MHSRWGTCLPQLQETGCCRGGLLQTLQVQLPQLHRLQPQCTLKMQCLTSNLPSRHPIMAFARRLRSPAHHSKSLCSCLCVSLPVHSPQTTLSLEMQLMLSVGWRKALALLFPRRVFLSPLRRSVTLRLGPVGRACLTATTMGHGAPLAAPAP